MVEPRLASVFAAVFGLEPDALQVDDSVDTVEGWDSVTHIQLVLALEEEFGVQFAPGDIAELVSVSAIQSRLPGGTGGE